MTTNGSLVCS